MPWQLNLVKKLLLNKIEESKKNDLFDKHLGPENSKFEFPWVNDFVWNYCLNETTRSTDVKVHKMQKTLLKGLGPMIKVVDSLLKPYHEFEKSKLFISTSVYEMVCQVRPDFLLSSYNQYLLHLDLKDMCLLPTLMIPIFKENGQCLKNIQRHKASIWTIDQ